MNHFLDGNDWKKENNFTKIFNNLTEKVKIDSEPFKWDLSFHPVSRVYKFL